MLSAIRVLWTLGVSQAYTVESLGLTVFRAT